MTIRIGKQAHKAFVDTLPFEMRAAALLGDRGFLFDGVVYVFDQEADHSHAVVFLLGKELERIESP